MIWLCRWPLLVCRQISSILAGFREKLEKVPTSAKFQNLNCVVFCPILMNFYAKFSSLWVTSKSLHIISYICIYMDLYKKKKKGCQNSKILHLWIKRYNNKKIHLNLTCMKHIFLLIDCSIIFLKTFYAFQSDLTYRVLIHWLKRSKLRDQHSR